MTRHRLGFTFAELMVVIVVAVIVMSIGVPRFNYLQQGANVRSARDQIAGYLATTRAAAIQRGRDARFTLKADTIVVERDQGGGVWVNVRPKLSLYDTFKVSVASSGVTTITYNSRGTAKSLVGTQRIVVSRDTKKDSVCISKFGMIMRKGCF